MQNNMVGRVANATKWSALAEIMAKIAAPIVNSVLARLLSPEMFGVVASMTIITSFADIFTDAGFQKYVIQHEYNSKESLNKDIDIAFTSNLLMSVIIYSLIFLFRDSLANLVHCPEASWALAVVALSVLCTSFSSINIAIFRRNLNFKPLFFVRMISSAIPLVVTVPLAFMIKNYWALVIGTVIQQLFVAVVTFIISEHKPKLRIDFSGFKSMLSFSIWNLLESISIWFTWQANVFIVAYLLDSYYLGLYRTSMVTINSYMAIITSAVTPVLFSTLSRYQNDSEGYRKTFLKFQKCISAFVVPMGVGIFVFRDLAVKILLGSQWMIIAGFLGLWALMSALTISFSNLACEVYRSKGKPKVSFVLQVIYIVFYIPTIYISTSYGFEYLCICACLIRFLPIVLDLITLERLFNIRTITIFKNVAYQMFAAIVMGISCYALRMIFTSVIWDFVVILIGCTLYFGMLYVNPKNRTDFVTIKEMIKHPKH